MDVFSCIHTKMYSFLGRIVQFETIQPFPAASLKIWTQTLWSKRSYRLLSLNPLNTTIEGKQPSQAVKPRYRNHLTYLARNVETRCCQKGWCITKNTYSAHFMKLITFYSMIKLESLQNSSSSVQMYGMPVVTEISNPQNFCQLDPHGSYPGAFTSFTFFAFFPLWHEPWLLCVLGKG